MNESHLEKIVEDANWNKKEVLGKLGDYYINPDLDYNSSEYTKIFVGGSAFERGKTSDDLQFTRSVNKAKQLGEMLADYDNIMLITGATPEDSMPHQVAESYREAEENAPIIGVVGNRLDNNEHLEDVKDTYSAILTYDFSNVPRFNKPFTKLMYRNTVNVSLSDGMITVMGGSGTMNEASAAYHEDVPIAMMKGTGGFSDIGKYTFDAISKSGQKGGNYIATYSPADAIEFVLENAGRET